MKAQSAQRPALVPFLDLHAVNARFHSEFETAIERVLASGRYLFGEESHGFAAEFSKSCGVDHCIPLASGLDALRLTLSAWISLGRIQLGDEVIVPANSFVASALAVTQSGLSLAFADVDEETSCVTAATIAASLSRRTRAVMSVHLYGQIAEIEDIKALCSEQSLLLLEDAAQAHGAMAGGQHAGTFGEAGAFSFYPSKNLGALGDAGCVVTNDTDLAQRAASLGNYGSQQKYRHEFRGINSRMDELQAAFLRVKLRRLDGDNARRREIARRYCAELAHPFVRLPRTPDEPSAHVWHLYVIRTTHRESLISYLRAHGVETQIHYPCAIHRQPAFAETFGHLTMPVAETLQREVLSLPISPVMSDHQVDTVISTINSWSGPDADAAASSDERRHGE